MEFYEIKNKEKIKKQRKEYRSKNVEKIRIGAKKYYNKNKEKERERVKKYKEENAEKIREYKRKYRLANLERIKENSKIYRKNNKEKIKKQDRLYRKKNIEWWKKYINKKYKENLKFNINSRMSRAVRDSLKVKRFLKSSKNGNRWENLVGYSVNDLIKRLKKTLPKGYTWKDYLSGELHIDHIIPIAVFNFTKVENPDFKRCWALSNLRLLPGRENMIKGKKIDRPFQPALKI